MWILPIIVWELGREGLLMKQTKAKDYFKFQFVLNWRIISPRWLEKSARGENWSEAVCGIRRGGGLSWGSWRPVLLPPLSATAHLTLTHLEVATPFHHLFIRILSSARHHLFVIILWGRSHQGLRAGAVHLLCHPPEGHHHLRIFLHSLYIFIFSVTTIPPIWPSHSQGLNLLGVNLAIAWTCCCWRACPAPTVGLAINQIPPPMILI